jgi:vanillate O-demethylase monooxygenase subunit
MQFQRNAWYIAAEAKELGRTLLARTIVGTPVLMFRRENGDAAAISNICPHRFAPLSRGTLIGDTVECKYHGLVFGADGRCVHNPYLARITPKMHIAHYPVVERHGFAWVWPGEAAAADPSRIPDMGEYEPGPDRRTVHSYLYTDYRYDILVDNLLDLTHADYLHVGSFSAGRPEAVELDVREVGDEVIVERIERRLPKPPYASFDGDVVDMRMLIHWHPGQVITFAAQVTAPGTAFDGDAAVRFFHVATPADQDHTHYFMGLRRIGPDDAEADAAAGRFQRGVIEHEDGPMLAAVHRNMAGRELMAMRPLQLPGDAGGLRVRRVIQRLLARESTSPATAAA